MCFGRMELPSGHFSPLVLFGLVISWDDERLMRTCSTVLFN
ncbi:hypothetical protein CES85_5673 [Ochrobactrum quorumnocens]|uniref:Uncharacterized protein n=1 Tax=Ochrobactrum quorumnocens TaxID=271865 RepID=A0A248UEW8_9HYPH|nr:hypothetical protein CES85_5673 [[Ochrobactrum] quorumnocens]